MNECTLYVWTIKWSLILCLANRPVPRMYLQKVRSYIIIIAMRTCCTDDIKIKEVLYTEKKLYRQSEGIPTYKKSMYLKIWSLSRFTYKLSIIRIYIIIYLLFKCIIKGKHQGDYTWWISLYIIIYYTI